MIIFCTEVSIEHNKGRQISLQAIYNSHSCMANRIVSAARLHLMLVTTATHQQQFSRFMSKQFELCFHTRARMLFSKAESAALLQ